MSHQEKILVTGASGFVGSAVARQLLEAGYSVRALVRGASPRTHLAGLNLEFFEGDLRDRKSVERASAGMRYVFHVAADYRLWARDRSEIFASNVEGTRNLMEAAIGAGIERVVYTSSVATIAVRSDGGAADESTPLREEQGIGAYKRSKIAAERLVEAMVAERGLPAVIVNPSTPIGPGDVKPTPTGRIIVEAAKGRIPAFIDTGLNLVHVDDVASGHLAALRRGRVGERYILGGQDVLFSQMLRDIADLVGRRAARVRLPWRAPSPSRLLPKPSRPSPAANLLQPGMGCTWPNTVCSSPRPRRSGNLAIAQGFIPRGSTTRCAGFATSGYLGS